ncbi:MAG: peptidoglycan-binding protein [candidate division KSB1 bacterium]
MPGLELEKLAKATIINLNDPGTPIRVLFNPEKYTMERSNQFAEIGIPGLSSPLLQFIRGNIKTLTMELFFDTYETKKDVRSEYIDKIMALMEIDPELHAPPICKFSWASLAFTGILERATRNFTMFLPDGIPVRCTMNVTFKEYTTVAFEIKKVTKNSPDRTKLRVLRQGEQLHHLAFREYEDPGQWRAIASANNIDNPRLLTPGAEITIPPLR